LKQIVQGCTVNIKKKPLFIVTILGITNALSKAKCKVLAAHRDGTYILLLLHFKGLKFVSNSRYIGLFKSSLCLEENCLYNQSVYKGHVGAINVLYIKALTKYVKELNISTR